MSAESLRKRFSLFKKKQTEELPPDQTFDENSFDFCLKGGPYQTSLIEASATFKKGKQKGAPLPLHCTWYRAARDSDFVVIEGYSGAFYQPTADDVGCKICVHAMPVSEVQEYTGMPAFAEVGPLQLDPEIKRNVQDFLTNGAAFSVTLICGLPDQSAPINSIISMSTDSLLIQDDAQNLLMKFPVTTFYPQVLIDCRSNCLVRLLPDEHHKIDISCMDAVFRDTFTLTARMFCGAKVAGDQADMCLKLQQINYSLVTVSKEREVLSTHVAGMKQSLEDTLKSDAEHAKRLREVEEELQRQNEKIKDYENELETHRQEVKFLRQDLNVYKNQCSDLDLRLTTCKDSLKFMKQLASKSSEQLADIVKRLDQSEQGLLLTDSLTAIAQGLEDYSQLGGYSSKDSSVKSAKMSEEDSTEGPDSNEERFIAEIKDLKKIISMKNDELDEYRKEMSEQLDKIQAEKNFYKRKVESIAQDNDKLLSKLGKNPREISAFENTKQEFECEKRRLLKDKDAAEAQAKFYLQLMQSTERKLADETRRNEELRILASKRPRADSKEFGLIINSLTQTLTEREAELVAQKAINRNLMNRLGELQAIVATMGCKV
mmetsp:Transcript_10571/g.20354  ORF Transcript_10571/g.20354 Transcript_10571/m.20354 type:complete len:602 (+) Transcript_10571:2840-4645(+)